MLRSKRIVYAVTDPHQLRTRQPSLFKKVFDLTWVLTERLTTRAPGEVIYFDTIEEALSSARSSDIAIIQSVGNFVLEYRFVDELDEFVRAHRDFLMLTCSPRDEDDVAGAFVSPLRVVNINAWRDLGFPRLDGVNASVGESDKLSVVATEASRVHIVDASLRDCFLYISPEVDSDRLNRALASRDDALVSHPDQKRWLNLSKPRSAIWIFNSEPYRFNIPLQHCDAYFGPAAGFKYLDVLAWNRDVEFFFYDVNDDSLEWIAALQREWDGEDFGEYLNGQPPSRRERFKYVNASIAQNQAIMFREFGGEERFKALWRLFKSAKVHFAKCDLFNSSDVASLLTRSTASRPFFYYSNIFSTNFTLTAFSREDAEASLSSFKSMVRASFPNAIMHGADIGGRWRTIGLA